MRDCVVVGGGAIGLSIAWEAAQRGRSVTLVDAGEFGQESSWAGAGILPPCFSPSSTHAYPALHRMSLNLYAAWAERLLAETGTDIGFRRCGGLYLALDRGEAASLAGLAYECEAEGVACDPWSRERLLEEEPRLAEFIVRESPLDCRYLPDECQVRNPRFVKALIAACVSAGVEMIANAACAGFEAKEHRIAACRLATGRRIIAETHCVAAGAWTPRLLSALDVRAEIFPVRGQMLLYRMPEPRLKRVINVGSRYLVPRDDGLLLVGSTEEEVGYEKGNTAEGLTELRRFAERIVPALRQVEPLQSWSGLRPATFDGLPYLGRVPGWDNLFVAAGHFRSGLTLAPGTAVALADAMDGATPGMDLTPFRLGR